jgi:hemerythrin-like metal-binding protein
MASWKDDLDSGVPEVDVEHQLQVRLLDSLLGALDAGAPRESLGQLLAQLEDATNVHFGSEELLMRLHAWERYEQHTEEHRALLEELSLLKALFEHGSGADLAAGAQRLQAWLARHIRGMDRAFAQYVAQGGLASQAIRPTP